MADIEITLAVRTPPANPELNYGLPTIIGPCSSGPYDTYVDARNNVDLQQLGYGPLLHPSAYTLLRAGGPVQNIRSRSTTPGLIWGPGLVKEPSGRATLYVIGRVKLAGADANGDIVWQGKQLGASIQVQLGAFAFTVNGKAILLSIPAATSAADVETYWNAQAALVALADISTEGTGASNAGTTLAATAFDLGTIAYTGNDGGYSVRQKQAGNSTVLGSSYGGQVLTIDLATDADGTATSTAAAVLSNIAPGAVGKFTAAAVLGGGTGLAGVQAAPADIPFGSGGTATLSGTPLDRANLVIEFVTAGTVGSTPAPVLRWAIDYQRREDARIFGRGNAQLALVARRAWKTDGSTALPLRVKVTQQTGNSKTLTHSFDGRDLEIFLGTTAGGVGNTTPIDVRTYILALPRLRAAFLVFIPAGLGTDPMEGADRVECRQPSVTWSAPILVPSTGVVPLRNGAVDTGVTLTLTGTWEQNDVMAAQLIAPVSSVDDMASAALAALADNQRRAGFLAFISPVSRAQAATISTIIQNALNGRQVWAQFQTREWDPETETKQAWKESIVADFLGFDQQLLERCDGEHTHVSAYTGRAITQPAITAACGTAALAPYHQDLGKVRVGPTSGILPNVTGLWHDEADDTTLTDNRGTCMRTDEDAPGAFYFRLSPSMADPTNIGRNRIQFVRTDLVCAREAKLILRQFRNSALDYQVAAGDDGSVAGALTLAAAASVEGALNAQILRELQRKKRDGESSISPLTPGQKVATVLRTNDYSNDRTIYVEVGAAKRPPAERGRITVYDRPE